MRTGPGGSARQEADRRRQRAADLLRSAERWERGAAGEERVAASLAWLPPAYTCLHDLRLPGSPSNIDHLVIGPVGVFLIDTKVHDGTVRYGNGTLWRGRFPMRREIEALNLEAARLGAVLDAPVVPAICFADGDLPRRNLTVGGVRILALAELLPFVAERAATVAPHEVERLVQEAQRLGRRTRARAADAAIGPGPTLTTGTPRPTTDTPSAAPLTAAAPAPPRPRLRPLRIAGGLALAGVAAYLAGTVLLAPARPAPAPRTTVGPGPAPVVAALRVVTRCPGAGQGWALTPQWPGLPAGATRYETSWRRADTTTWILAGWWSSADQLTPLALANLTAGATVELRLVAQDAAQRVVSDRVTPVTLPTDPC